MRPTGLLKIRRRAYEILEIGRGEDRLSILFDNAIILLIVLNVIAFTLETVPEIQSRYGDLLFAF